MAQFLVQNYEEIEENYFSTEYDETFVKLLKEVLEKTSTI